MTVFVGPDLHACVSPSLEQCRQAQELLLASPGAYAVCVPIALPGKEPGVWVVGQRVEYPSGLFLARTHGWLGEASYASARSAAEGSADWHLGDRPGVPAYAVIFPDGHWRVVEGVRLFRMCWS